MCSLLAVSLWESGRVPVSQTGDSGFEHSTFFLNNIILSLNSLNSLKTFRENSILLLCKIVEKFVSSLAGSGNFLFSLGNRSIAF